MYGVIKRRAVRLFRVRIARETPAGFYGLLNNSGIEREFRQLGVAKLGES